MIIKNHIHISSNEIIAPPFNQAGRLDKISTPDDRVTIFELLKIFHFRIQSLSEPERERLKKYF